jgi:Tol biopolymer transport system component
MRRPGGGSVGDEARSGGAIRSLLILLAVVGVILAVAAPAHAAFPGANGKIAYVRDAGQGVGTCPDEIDTINPDGTGVSSLTSSTSTNLSPAWSADGQRIVFARAQGVDCNTTGWNTGIEIWVMNADGSGQVKLTNNTALDDTPAWSPDGTKIVFVSNRDGPLQVYTMNADGTNQVRLTTIVADDREPTWSPNGQTIAFERNGAIYEIPADGSGVATNISNPAAHTYDEWPDWSPDGQRIVFDRIYTPDDDYLQNIVVMNADGTNQHGITSTSELAYDLYPVWSPDGKKIASYRGGTNVVLNADGSGPRIPITAPRSFQPDWQPLPGPQRSDFKNASQFCKAKRASMGESAFGQTYGDGGSGANAFGKCVSADGR